MQSNDVDDDAVTLIDEQQQQLQQLSPEHSTLHLPPAPSPQPQQQPLSQPPSPSSQPQQQLPTPLQLTRQQLPLFQFLLQQQQETVIIGDDDDENDRWERLGRAENTVRELHQETQHLMQRLLDNIAQLNDQHTAYQGMLSPGQRRVYTAAFGSGNAERYFASVSRYRARRRLPRTWADDEPFTRNYP